MEITPAQYTPRPLKEGIQIKRAMQTQIKHKYQQMLAKIHLKKLKANAIIGAYKIERDEKQPLVIQACIEVDIEEGTRTDDINSTVNYSKVAREIIKISEATEFNLLESFVVHLAKRILEKFEIISIKLIVEKPYATKGLSDISIEYFLKA